MPWSISKFKITKIIPDTATAKENFKFKVIGEDIPQYVTLEFISGSYRVKADPIEVIYEDESGGNSQIHGNVTLENSGIYTVNAYVASEGKPISSSINMEVK